MGLRTRVAAVVLTLLVAALVWTDAWPQVRGPAPWPPEWQWLRRTEPTSREPLAALLGGALLVALVAAPDALLRRRGVLAAGIAAGLLLHLGLAQLEPRGAWRTLIRNTSESSYHRVAVATADEDVSTFLRNHAQRLEGWTGRDRHAATHPPGPVLLHRAVLAVVGNARAAALGASVLFALLTLAAAWPITVLARQAGATTEDARRVGLLWCLLPGPAVLVGQLDPALALPVAGCAAALVVTLKDGGWPWALVAGLAAAAALQLSYGAAVFVAFAVVTAIAIARPSPGSAARSLAAAGAVGLALTLLPALLGHDVLAAAVTALRIHRDEYTRARSYGLWLPWNVLDVTIFLGVPVAVLLAASRTTLARAVLGALAVLLLLGIVRGEAGRIWSPLMPLLLVTAVVGRTMPRPWWAALAGGLLLLGFVVRVSWHVF